MISTSDLFITGTDTNVGKTVLSALLCAALHRSYWKPIQTGIVEGSDRTAVITYAGISEAQALPENYRFEPPVSPHLAARMAGVRIELKNVIRPATPNSLIIEGAGGVLVPINDRDLMVDLMVHLSAPVVLATRCTLGTINHTLLSITVLRQAGVSVKGVVMIGDANEDNRRAIEHYGNIAVVGWIPMLAKIHREALLDVYNRHFQHDAFS
jgi:dethiobiotin synthase